MSEPIYRQPGLVVTDGDRVLVLGPPAGPAGSSIVELPDGSSWQVDHVDPTVPVQLDADATDPARSPLLVTAFGGDEALFLVDDAIPLAADGTDSDFLEGRRPARGRYVTPTRRFRNVQAREAGERVLLGDMASDRRLHPLARVAASLEFILPVNSSVARPVLDPLVPAMLESADALGREVDDEDLTMLEGTVLDGLDSLCRRAQKTTRQVPPLLRDLTDRIDRIAAQSADLLVSALRMPMDRVEADLADEELLFAAPPPATAPPPRRPDRPVLSRIGDALVNVTVARSDTERWARVLHRNGMVLLGEVPLRRDGLVDVAEVVVPADVLDEDLEVQVSDLDDLRVLVGRPVEAIRAAVTAGREAARSDRLGDISVARSRWQRCAELWDRAGDPQRSEQAYDLSADPGIGRGPRASTADEIAEALASVV